MTLHLAWLAADRMLLVHQGPRDLLVARHRRPGGPGEQPQRWVELPPGPQPRRRPGDPALRLAAAARSRGQRRADLLAGAGPAGAGTGEAGPPLLPGQTLSSEGLEASAVAVDSRALQLRVGRQRWLLLPDRQALWSWERSTPASWPANVWLGFRPRQGDQHSLADGNLERVWWSGIPPPAGKPCPQAGGPAASAAPCRRVEAG